MKSHSANFYLGGVNCKSNFSKVIMTQSSRKKVFEVPKRINKLRKVFSINIFPQITFMKHLNDCLSVWSVFWKVCLPIICNFVVTHRWIFFLKKQSTFLKKSSFLPTCKKQTWRSFMPIQEKKTTTKQTFKGSITLELQEL